MEVNITKKYAEDFLNGKVQKHLKITDAGSFFTGAIKFEIPYTDSPVKKIKISLWPKDSKEPIFIVREEFRLEEGATFTFEPFTLQVDVKGFKEEYEN